jgi:serine protease Do
VISREVVEIINIPLADGMLVEKVDSGSPAQQAGIRGGNLPLTIAGEQFLLGGDIITEMNGHSPNDPKRFAEMVASLQVGETVRLTLYQEKQVKHVMFILEEQPLLPGDLRPSAFNTQGGMANARKRPPQNQQLVKPHSR